MIAVANRIPVNPELAGAFEERFLNRPGQVEQQPGFVATHLLRPTEPGQPYTVLTYWESREAFEAWRNSPDFKEGHKGGHTLPEGTVTGRNVLEIWDVFSRTGQVL
ncbi:antibiotic biosynthesis monooxygenase family protein [Deinococcus lacus]|uniref:Antibiotic biosynthesis monooxygenase family protein n=1 Tax=Deinococcus lacus TaxID=392561 RepID=A0ABW1YD09_9DEIO